MKDREIVIPPFVQSYIDKVDGNGLSDFVKVSAEYQAEKEAYAGRYAEQAARLQDYNRRTGQSKTLSYEDGLKKIETNFQQRAYQTAKQHGYTGPDPNQPADKEFTKQGVKFQAMINQARERQNQQSQQQEPKPQPEVKPGQEKKNIEALKQQSNYQQSQAKVAFKDVQQEQSYSSEKQSRENERAAFLKQIKQTRDQQTRQQDKQREL